MLGGFGDVGFGVGVVDGAMRVMGGAIEGVKLERGGTSINDIVPSASRYKNTEIVGSGEF